MDDLWNGDSPNVHLIKAHYEAMHLNQFDNARVARVCKTLRCTLDELCALACVFGKSRVRDLWERCEKSGKPWPPEIALHFYNLERFANELAFQTASFPSPPEINTALILTRDDRPKNPGNEVQHVEQPA